MGESVSHRQIESLRRHVIELELHARKGVSEAHESEERFRSIIETLTDGVIAKPGRGTSVTVVAPLAAASPASDTTTP